MSYIIFSKHTERSKEFFNKMRQPIAAGIHAIVDAAEILPDNQKTGTPEDHYPF